MMEEMRRIQVFLAKHAEWWSERESARTDVKNTAQLEGLVAYARRQAHLCTALREGFKQQWYNADDWVKFGEVPEDLEVVEVVDDVTGATAEVLEEDGASGCEGASL